MREGKRKGYEQREADRHFRREQERREMTRKERRKADRRDRKKAGVKRVRNKEFARVTYIFVALFLGMMGYIVHFQIVKSQELVNSPYNARKDSFAEQVIRGDILDRNGMVLARTEIGRAHV